MEKNNLQKRENRVSKMESRIERKIKNLVSVAAVSKFAGLNTDAENLELIAEYLAEYYPRINPDEIMTAYKMTISGRLDGYFQQINGQPDNKHYNNFSAAWISKILNAYKKHKIATTPKKKFIALPPSREKQIEARNKFIEYLVGQYDNFIAGREVEILLPHHVCNVLHAVGLLDEKPEPNKDDIRAAILDVVKSNTVNKYAKRNALRDSENSPVIQSRAGRIAEQKLILKTFEKINKQNINFKKHLEENYEQGN